jgi:hypothetical protein
MVGAGNIMLKKLIDAEQDQRADCARIDAAVESAQQQISALPERCVSPAEARKQWSAIRDRTILLLRDVRGNILSRANAAKETRRSIIEAFLRDGAPSSSPGFVSMLADIPTEALLDHLQYLIRVGDRPHAQQICAAFEAREDRQAYMSAFEEIVAEWVFSQSGNDLAERVAGICHLAEEADAKITTLLSSPNWRDRDAAKSSREESELVPIGGDQEGAPNLTTAEFTLAPSELPVAEEETRSSIAANDHECSRPAKTIESPPVSSHPLDALFAALTGATDRFL